MKRSDRFHEVAAAGLIDALPLKVRVAIQGGGTLGRYGLAVVKNLMEDPNIEVVEMSGVSAGGVNAALLSTVGADKAETFWNNVGVAGQAAQFCDLNKRLYDLTPMSYLWSSHQMSQFFETATALDFLEAEMRRLGVTDEKLQQSPIKLHVTTVTQHDPDKGFGAGNITEHIHTNKGMTVQKIAASGALQSLGSVKIDGVDHWDGAYSGNNPNLSMFEKPSNIPLIVVSVDRPGVVTSGYDPDLRYGMIHDEVKRLQKLGACPVHHVALQQKDNWDDGVRAKPVPTILRDLGKMGDEDGQALVEELHATYRPQHALVVARHTDMALQI